MPSESNSYLESLPPLVAKDPVSLSSAAVPLRPYVYLTALVVGYIGIYLCRKNLSVAVPILQKDWGISKESIGAVASVSTIAYAAGKIIFGPLVDRFGGRSSMLASMLLVALFGALGACSPTLGMLTLAYSANRLSGAASWGAMVKQVPEWFAPRQMPLALGVLSLSYVFGGAIAVYIAGQIAALSGDSWRAIMGYPSVLLVIISLLCWKLLPRVRSRTSEHDLGSPETKSQHRLAELVRDPQFHIICALSFTLTFLRETFNFWTVDFLKTEVVRQLSSGSAASWSMSFDLLGGLGILWLGWIYPRISYQGRSRLLFGNLVLLAALLWFLPGFFHSGIGWISLALGLVGFLVYGPYSLLAGVLSVEVRGKERAATVSGWVDGIGYFAGALSGICMGQLLAAGGYKLGFEFMAGLTLVSAVLCLFLYPKSKFGCAQPAPAQS